MTDAALKALKLKDELYKIADRDGMYVVVQPSGAIVFRYDYRMNGRWETLKIGRYGPADLSLARAREKCIDAKRAIAEGLSPAHEKQREKRKLKEARALVNLASVGCKRPGWRIVRGQCATQFMSVISFRASAIGC